MLDLHEEIFHAVAPRTPPMPPPQNTIFLLWTHAHTLAMAPWRGVGNHCSRGYTHACVLGPLGNCANVRVLHVSRASFKAGFREVSNQEISLD